MKIKYLVTLFFLFINAATLFSAEPVIVTPNEQQTIGGENIGILSSADPLKITDIIHSHDFKPSSQAVPNLGISNLEHWLKFTIVNQTNDEGLLLEIGNPIIDEVVFYEVSPEGIKNIRTGENTPISERLFKSQNFLFNLDIPVGGSQTYFLKIKSGEQAILPIKAGSSSAIYQGILLKDVIMGLYIGIILSMFFYNLFVFFTTKDGSYLIYVFYVLAVGLVQAAVQGYTYVFLWPESPWLASNSIYFFNTLTAFLSVMFMRSFIRTKNLVPKLDKAGNLFLLSYLICLTLALVGSYNLAYNLMNATALFLALYMLIVAGIAVKKGSRPALFFLIAWSSFLMAVIVFVLKDTGLLPYNTLTSSVLQLGSGAEVVLLSFGLADKINILKKEKEESQRQALQVSKENERIVREQNIILEAKVSERTKELEKSNTELGTTLTELKNAQTQLVDQEKMASLGQLTAGIAHEINNPINFVTSNVNPLRRDVEDVFELLDKYQELETPEDFLREKEDIEEFIEEIDLEFVRDEITSLLKGIAEGASRTAEIVRGLKVFSRMDEQDLKRVDISEGISSTLTLLRSSMHGRIDVETDFQSIGNVECYAGKLNQVFMNIMSNSIHAMLSKEGIEKGLLRVAVRDAGENVTIEIEDNGIGMSPDVKQRIFEPFFTTKKVGEGTGLGMSITFSIIEKHHGHIECESEEGKGTRFIITLPKIQTHD